MDFPWPSDADVQMAKLINCRYLFMSGVATSKKKKKTKQRLIEYIDF